MTETHFTVEQRSGAFFCVRDR